ncbi:MAG: chemotaxis protein CheB [Anaerolineales bacterium]|nr:chemotaxis protein CheB [Anaerolineales bacterium]
MTKPDYRAIVIGASAGGMNALMMLFSVLKNNFPLPILVAQHVHPTENGTMVLFYQSRIALPVKEANDKDEIRPGVIYFAPPDYHLLVERQETLALSIDPKVNYSRPSIDVLFESAAYAWTCSLIGIILTGANYDGARGLRLIKELGGWTIAQDPSTAEFPAMPQAAIDLGSAEHILTLHEIGKYLSTLENPN